MRAPFQLIDGALRVRLSSAELVRARDDSSAVGEAVRSASAGLVVVEGFTRQASVGLHFRIGIRGTSAAAVLRRLSTAPGRFTSDPSAEVSVFLTESVLAEVMRCIPRRPDFSEQPRAEVRIPWEAAIAIAHDAMSPGAAYAQVALGWDALPDPIASVLGPLSAEASITIASSAGTAVYRWVSGDDGWLAMGFADQELVLSPNARDDVAGALTRSLTTAVDSMVAGAR